MKLKNNTPTTIKIFSVNAPNFLCRPERVRGMPICREMRALAAEMPKNLRQENPPLFIVNCALTADWQPN